MAKIMVFIDSRVNDLDLLVSQFDAGTEYNVLDAGYDGLLQMEESLAGKSDYSSIQIISHGAAGAITIGSTVLNSNNLLQHQSQLDNIGHALTDSGDLLLYGCSVGAGATGQHFVETLAQLTGADVAASDDVTWGVAVGGDWVLELATGTIESVVPVAEEDLQQYEHTLGSVDDYILAKMSLVAYYDDPSHPKEKGILNGLVAENAWNELKMDGWKILQETENNHWVLSDSPDEPTFKDPLLGFVNKGFSASVFEKDNAIVIAYRGTNDPIDVLEYPAIGALTDAWANQFTYALKVADFIKEKYSKDNYQIQVTGHSLGGSLAQIVSQMFGFSGATFDPAGVKNLADDRDFQSMAKDLKIASSGVGVPADFKNYLVEAFPVSGIPLLTNDHIGATETLQKDGRHRLNNNNSWYGISIFLH